MKKYVLSSMSFVFITIAQASNSQPTVKDYTPSYWSKLGAYCAAITKTPQAVLQGKSPEEIQTFEDQRIAQVLPYGDIGQNQFEYVNQVRMPNSSSQTTRSIKFFGQELIVDREKFKNSQTGYRYEHAIHQTTKRMFLGNLRQQSLITIDDTTHQPVVYTHLSYPNLTEYYKDVAGFAALGCAVGATAYLLKNKYLK